MRATPDGAGRAPTRLGDLGPLPERCRIVIVGSGLVGGEIAKELERRGVDDTLVLEAGPADDLRHTNVAYPADAALRLWLEAAGDTHFHRPWASASPPHYTASSGLRQRLGGRSLYWYGVTLPIEPWALTPRSWPDAVVSDLCESWEGGAALYERVARELRDWRCADGPDETLDAAPAHVGPHRLLPTPRAIRPSSRDRGHWYAYSPLDRWRDPETGALKRRPAGVRFRAGASVTRVLAGDGRARGVVVRSARTGERSQIACDVVVLAAGTIENARLAAQALHESGALAVPLLSGLYDHIVQGVFVRVEPPHAGRLLRLLRPGSYFAACPHARSNLFLDIAQLAAGDVLVDLQLTGEQLPSSSSQVCCDASADVPWPVTVTTTTTTADLAVVADQQAILRDAWHELAGACGLRRVAPEFGDYNNPLRTNAFVFPESLRAAQAGAPATWSSFLGTEDHEGGTLPIGEILDDDQQLKALRGLYAAGPCTFPRPGAANPGLTALALARRLAARLARG